MLESNPADPFVERLTIPPIGKGLLSGYTFGVKDLFEVKGMVTGGGNPDWKKFHSFPAASSAPSVELCLRSGAEFVGKTITDELAFSLDGENTFYGTPLNPSSPDRVPGGSSSGSASAVAQGLCDFALGTDTGGSIRVPASNCGIYGYRPTHGRISVSGVIPFAPTFDTVGVAASSAKLMKDVASVLLPESSAQDTYENIYLLKEAFELADDEIKQSLRQKLGTLGRLQQVSLSDILGYPSSLLDDWLKVFTIIQWEEIWASLGSWIEFVHPTFGQRTKSNFEHAKTFDRSDLAEAVKNRESYFKKLNEFLGPKDLLCLPTTPAFAPIKGSLGVDRTFGNYYPRALALTSISGICRLPQVTIPSGTHPSAGLSFIAGQDRDHFLLDFICES